jgi:hypothetical protein
VGHPEEFSAGTLAPMHLQDANLLRARLAVAKEQHTHEQVVMRLQHQHRTTLLIMIIAGVWLILDLAGALFGVVDVTLAGTLANPGFAMVAGAAGHRLSQQGSPNR